MIIDGRQLYPGHKLAWRAGVLEKTGHAVCANVRLDLTGRERKQKVVAMPMPWLIVETPSVLEKLRIAGVIASD